MILGGSRSQAPARAGCGGPSLGCAGLASSPALGVNPSPGHWTREGFMRAFADFDAVKAAVGEEIGVSDWVLVSQERIDRFAEATGDDQWIHVDVERARRELPYGTTIAHGLLTLSLLPSFFRTVLRVDGLKNSLNYGSNRIRYMAPVPAGSRLRGR